MAVPEDLIRPQGRLQDRFVSLIVLICSSASHSARAPPRRTATPARSAARPAAGTSSTKSTASTSSAKPTTHAPQPQPTHQQTCTS